MTGVSSYPIDDTYNESLEFIIVNPKKLVTRGQGRKLGVVHFTVPEVAPLQNEKILVHRVAYCHRKDAG